MRSIPISEINPSELASDGAVRTPRPTFRLQPLSRWTLFRQKPEIILFVVLILVFNLPVLFGTVWNSMVFEPEAVRAGEWWRLLTHPFVHLTWYHLMLDGMAFLSLYCSLNERRIFVRLGYVVAAGTGSLVASWIAVPAISTSGLCGLSGIAHGLMAISAIELLGGDKTERRIGWISLILVLGKASFETITGKMVFGFLDFGLLGSPVAVSHAGGIIGGLIAMLVLALRRQTCRGSTDYNLSETFRWIFGY